MSAAYSRLPDANQSLGSHDYKTKIIMAQVLQMPLARLLSVMAQVMPHERKAAVLAFACNFALLGSSYILRPLRDTMGTIFGVAELQNLFTGTFILIFL